MDDVLPGPVRRFGVRIMLPLAIAAVFTLAIWAFSRGTGYTVAGTRAQNSNLAYISGVVIANKVSSAPLEGPSFATVLGDDDALYKLVYMSAWNRCSKKETVAIGSGLAAGDRIKIFGIKAGPDEISVCASPEHYVEPVGKADVFGTWKVYAHGPSGLSLRYPQSWELATSAIAEGSLVTKLGPASSTVPAITLTQFSAPGFSANEWIDRYYVPQSGSAQMSMVRTPATIGGADAVVLETEDEGDGKAVFAKSGDYIVQFELPPQDPDSDFAGIIEELVLSSVALASGSEEPSVAVESRSGAEGTVMIGPICPVGMFDASSCEDRPYRTTLRVSDLAGEEVAKVETSKDGTFRVALDPGPYSIESDSTSAPRLEPYRFVVAPGAFVRLDLEVDSGIR